LTDAQRTLYHFTHLRWPWLSLLAKRRKVESQVLTAA
jgi:hypothetical protein